MRSRTGSARDRRAIGPALLGCLLAAVAALALIRPATAVQAAAGERSGAAACAPVQELHFVCGAHHPEDMARVPGTRWVIVSGFAAGGGLQLLDTHALTLRRWRLGADAPDGTATPLGAGDCRGAPRLAALDTQGLSLRRVHGGRYRLYVVNHGGRESIEIFDVTVAAGAPTGRWRGCVLMPPGEAANAVSSFPDGTIIATVLNRPGTTKADFVRGRATGGVYEWRPGSAGFRLLPGTGLPGDNGLAAAPDGRTFYVVAFGLHAVYRYSRLDTRRPIRMATAPGFMPDNIHWWRGRLIAAGMTYDEPACGGIRGIVNGHADPMLCHRGYVIAAVDPRTLHFTVLARGRPNPAFNGVTTGLVIGNRLWISSYQADRVAYRRLDAGRGRP